MDDRNRKAKGSDGALPLAHRDGVLATDLGDEIVLYDTRQHKAHCLNPSAAAVWRHLDGKTSMAELVVMLRKDVDRQADEQLVWLALEELRQAELLDTSAAPVSDSGVSRRSALRNLAAAGILVPAISSLVAPPAQAQVSAVGCSPPDSCATFTCAGSCACVPTTEGTTVCIVPTCVSACTTTADCPPGTVCFTLGCCGPATFCVPIAPPGTNCLTLTANGQAWQPAQ